MAASAGISFADDKRYREALPLGGASVLLGFLFMAKGFLECFNFKTSPEYPLYSMGAGLLFILMGFVIVYIYLPVENKDKGSTPASNDAKKEGD